MIPMYEAIHKWGVRVNWKKYLKSVYFVQFVVSIGVGFITAGAFQSLSPIIAEAYLALAIILTLLTKVPDAILSNIAWVVSIGITVMAQSIISNVGILSIFAGFAFLMFGVGILVTNQDIFISIMASGLSGGVDRTDYSDIFGIGWEEIRNGK